MLDTDKFNDQGIVARTIWGEARGESYKGKQAVACVLMNRIKSGLTWWGHDLRSCSLKPYQFSCWLVGDPNRAKLMEITADDPIFRECLDIAELAVNGTLHDVVDGADSYYAKGTPTPRWAQKLNPWIEIGHHLFFRTI